MQSAKSILAFIQEIIFIEIFNSCIKKAFSNIFEKAGNSDIGL